MRERDSLKDEFSVRKSGMYGECVKKSVYKKILFQSITQIYFEMYKFANATNTLCVSTRVKLILNHFVEVIRLKRYSQMKSDTFRNILR